jgi:site-specific DNA recombinase
VSGGVVRSAAPKAIAIYIRWSTDEQTEGTTREVQLERCTLFIRSQGWEVNEDLVFVDDGYSGGSLERPALAKLRQLVQVGRVDCVVSYSVDRLSRNLGDTVTLVQKEWSGRATFRSASQPISTDEGNPAGQLVFNVLASFAEFERGLIRERTSSGLIRRARQGKYMGSRTPPMGYKRMGAGELEIDSVVPDGQLSGDAAVVKQIYGWALSGPFGQGPTIIARRLNEMGVPSPRGRKWFDGSVRWILRNPIYAGTVVYGRRRINAKNQTNSTRVSLREDPLAKVTDAMPAIVSREDWERVQQLEAGRRNKSRGRGVLNHNRALLTGLVRCRCGGPLHVTYKGERRFYRCTRYAQGGVCPFEPGHYQVEKIEQVVINNVKGRYGDAQLRERVLTALDSQEVADKHRKNLQAALQTTEKRTKAVEEQLVRLRRAARAEEIQLKTYEELRADAEAELVELSQRKVALEVEIGQTQAVTTAVDTWKEVVAQVELWDGMDQGRQREVLFSLVQEVTVYRARRSREPIDVEVVWKMPIEV